MRELRNLATGYSITGLKRPLQKKTKNCFSKLIIAGQKYCRMLSLQYFPPSLSYHLSVRPLSCLFLSDPLRQVLLYSYRGMNITGIMWNKCSLSLSPIHQGAQWLSGRVLDMRSRGCWLEPHRQYCVVSSWARHINPCLVLVSLGKISSDMTEKLLTGT